MRGWSWTDFRSWVTVRRTDSPCSPASLMEPVPGLPFETFHTRTALLSVPFLLADWGPVRRISMVLATAIIAVCTPVVSVRRFIRSPQGPTPRTTGGKPDFSGVWQNQPVGDVTSNRTCCKQLPFTAWGMQQWKSYDAEKGDYTGACLPFGLLRSVGGSLPIQIVQNQKYFAMLYEQNSWFHVTPIDGLPHPKNPYPTWFGNSVGRWEGDTLVIDTIAFNGKTKVDLVGHPVSNQLHTIERYVRPDLGRIQYSITVDDPKAYTQPWTSYRTWVLHPEWEIMEYSCEENNKDLTDGHIKAPRSSMLEDEPR
jgi:hypothetical protein